MQRFNTIRIICGVVGCLLISSCGSAEQAANPNQTGPPDKALRHFLGIASIEAKYALPVGEDHFELAVIHFAQGKILLKTGSITGSVASSNRMLEAQLLAGPSNDRDNMHLVAGPPKSRYVVTLFTTQGAARFDDVMWNNLDGGTTSSSGPLLGEFRNWRILGFAQSKQSLKNKTDISYADFTQALENKTYVGALAIRTYKTAEEANNDKDK